MLTGFPNYHYFKNGNAYSGGHEGMRYLLTPGDRPDETDPEGKKKLKYLEAVVWPEPWSIEHTAPEKQLHREFAHSEDGLREAIAWVVDSFTREAERWQSIPALLDCMPEDPETRDQLTPQKPTAKLSQEATAEQKTSDEDAPPWEKT